MRFVLVSDVTQILPPSETFAELVHGHDEVVQDPIVRGPRSKGPDEITVDQQAWDGLRHVVRDAGEGMNLEE